MADKSVTFRIFMKNKAGAGLASFKTDLEAISASVKSIGDGLKGTGPTKLIKTIDSVKLFVSEINKIGGKKSSDGFVKISKAFGEIGAALKVTSENMTAFSTSMQTLIKVGSNISNITNGSDKTVSFFANISKSLEKIGKSPSNKRLDSLSTFFFSINQLAGGRTVDPLVEAVDSLGASTPSVERLAVALQGIATSLTTKGVGSAARDLALIAQGGGGGGGYIQRASMGMGALGQDFQLKGMESADKYVNELTNRDNSDKKILESAPSAEKIADNLEAKLKAANDILGDKLTTWGIKADKKTQEWIQNIQKRKSMPVILNPSMSITEATSKDYSGAGGVSRELATMRGLFIHAGAEEMVQSAQKGAGGLAHFLDPKSKMLGGTEHHRYLTDLGDQLSKAYRVKIEESAELKNQYLGPKDLNKIRRNQEQIQKEILKIGHGETGIFGMIKKLIDQEVIKSGKTLEEVRNSVKLITEHKFKPMEIMKPGGGFAKGVPEELKKSLNFQLSRLKKELIDSKRPDKWNKFMTYIKDYGLTISGQADLIAMINGKAVGLFDYKSGKKSSPQDLQTILQSQMYADMYNMETKTGRPTPYGVFGGSESGKIVSKLSDVDYVKKQVADTDYVRKKESRIYTKPTKEETKARETAIIAETNATENLKNEISRESEVREKNVSIIKEQDKVLKEIASTKVSAEETSGGSGNSISGLTMISAEFVNRDKLYDDSGRYISQYTDNITRAYLNQEMLNQHIDLTKVKMSQVRRIIDGLSGSMSKHISITGSSNESFDKRAILLEKLSEKFNNVNLGMERNKKLTMELNSLQDQSMMEIKRLSKGDVNKLVSGIMGDKAGDPTQFAQKIKQVKVFADQPMYKEKTGKLISYLEKISKRHVDLTQKIELNRSKYEDFERQMGSIGSKSKELTGEFGFIITELKKLDNEFNKDTKSVNGLKSAMKAVSGVGQRLDMEMLSAGTEAQLKKEIDLLKERTKLSLPSKYQKGGMNTEDALAKSSRDFAMEDSDIEMGRQARSNALNDIRVKYDLVSQSMSKHRNIMAKVAIEQGESSSEYKRLSGQLDIQASKFNFLRKEMAKIQTQYNSLGEVQRQTAGKTSEHFRATVRTTIKGFGDMMKSQMAWVAGYGLMFGAMNLLKESFKSVITVQHEFARALRTARSEVIKTSELLSEYMDVGVKAMIKFGQNSEMVGEILYHLGSAGLFAKESLGALNSTMSMIIATEADVSETTKMVAGIYNNFSDQIISSTGAMGKFKYINDVIVATFRDHQVEIKELRDGLKHLSAMGKESNLMFTEQVAVLATLNDHLIKSGIAGRSVQTMLSKISKSPLEFAKAFQIQIDPLAPLNLVDILEQVNVKLKGGALTIQQVGNVFDNLGLRGAKTFITLAKYVDELKANIESLKNQSAGATDEMAEIMLDKPDVAFARMKETFAALVREGFGPAVEASALFAKSISTIGMVVSESGSATKAFLSGITRFIALIGTATVVARIFKLSMTKYWGDEASDRQFLGKKFDTFKKETGKASRDVKEKFKNIFATITTGGAGIFTKKGPNVAGKGSIINPDLRILTFYDKLGNNFTRTAIRAGRLNMAINSLGVALMGSAFAFKIILGVAAAYAAIKLVDYLVTTREEYVKLAVAIGDTVAQQSNELTQMDQKIQKQKEVNGVSEVYTEILEKQRRMQREKFIEGIGEQLKTVMKGYKDVKGPAEETVNFLDYLDNLRKGPGDKYSKGMGATQSPNLRRLGESKDQLVDYRIAIGKILASFEELKESGGEGFKELNNFISELASRGIDLNKVYKDLDVLLDRIRDKLKTKRQRAYEAENEKNAGEKKEAQLALAGGAYNKLLERRINAARQGEYANLMNKIRLTEEKITGSSSETYSIWKKKIVSLAKTSKLTAQQYKDLGAATKLQYEGLGNYKEMEKTIDKLINLLVKKTLLWKDIQFRIIESVRATKKLELSSMSFLNNIQGSTFGVSPLSTLFTIDTQTELKTLNQISAMESRIQKFNKNSTVDKIGWLKGSGESKFLLNNYQNWDAGKQEAIVGLAEKHYRIVEERVNLENKAGLQVEKSYKIKKAMLDLETLIFNKTFAAADKMYTIQQKLGSASDISLVGATASSEWSKKTEKTKEEIALNKLSIDQITKARRSASSTEELGDMDKTIADLKGINAILEIVLKNQQDYQDVAVGFATKLYFAKQAEVTANSTFTLAEATRTATDEFREMAYGMSIARSKEEELFNVGEQYASQIQGINSEVSKNNILIMKNNVEMNTKGKYNEFEKLQIQKQINQLANQNELSLIRIELLREELKWKLYLVDINRDIADSEFRAAAAKEAYQSSIGSSGSYDDNVNKNIGSLKTYIELSEKAEEKNFYDIQLVKLKELKASEEEISAAITGFTTKMYNDRTLKAKAYYDYIIQRQNELYQAEAEVAMRTAESDKEVFNATLDSIGAGFSQYYTSIENTSKAISNSVNKTMGDLTSSLVDFTSALSMGFPEVSGEVDGLRQRLGDLEQQYNDAMGQDRLDQVAALRNEMSKVKDEIDDLQDPIQRAADYFEQFAETVIKEVQKMVIELLIMKPLMDMAKGWLNQGASSYGGSTYTGSSDLYSGGSGSTIMAEGGLLYGGIPGKDSIPILGMPGEYMIPKDSVDYYGIGLMERLRNRDLDRMAEGGLVGGGLDYGSNSGSSFGTTISVNLENKGQSNIEASEATMTQIDPGKYIVNVILDDVDSYGPLYQAFKGGR